MNQPLTRTQQIENRIDPATAGAIAVRAGSGLTFQNAVDMMEFSKLMAVSDKAIPPYLRNNVGACLGIIVQSNEWGMSPYQVARQSYVVNDQIAYMSQVIQAVIILRAPIKDGIIEYGFEGEGATRKCTASVETTTGRKLSVTSPMFKDIKVKNSPLWTSDPDQQFCYYTGRALCRRHFPSVLLGVYDVDEIEGAASQIKDVTPRGTGFADRLQAANHAAPHGGFNAEAVTSVLDNVGGESPEVDWNDARQATEALGRKMLPPGYSFAAGVLTVPDDAGDSESRGASVIFGRFSEIVTTSGQVLKSKDPIPDNPEAERAGAQAFIDGEERHAPDDFSPADGVAWLKGYDAVKGGA